MRPIHGSFFLLLVVLVGCPRPTSTPVANEPGKPEKASVSPITPVIAKVSSNPLVAHVVVALCDNKHQGIVPVPAQLGNGQDPDSNLYWGALYGVRTFMVKKAKWTLVQTIDKPSDGVLERIILKKGFKRKGKQVEVYLVADAWDGRAIRSTIGRFLQYSVGKSPETIKVPNMNAELRAGGASHLIGYVGHNGLMEFSLDSLDLSPAQTVPQAATVLACKSEPYFADKIKGPHGRILILTTNLMAPEAYTLDAIFNAWARGGNADTIHVNAANAYQTYQKCSKSAASRMFSVSKTP